MNKQWVVDELEQGLYEDVKKDITCEERTKYEYIVDLSERLYQAYRSVKGMELCDDGSPLDEPFEGCADVGNPLELTLIQELVPSVMAAHLGMKPITESQRMTPKGLAPAGEIDDFLGYGKPIKRKNYWES